MPRSNRVNTRAALVPVQKVITKGYSYLDLASDGAEWGIEVLDPNSQEVKSAVALGLPRRRVDSRRGDIWWRSDQFPECSASYYHIIYNPTNGSIASLGTCPYHAKQKTRCAGRQGSGIPADLDGNGNSDGDDHTPPLAPTSTGPLAPTAISNLLQSPEGSSTISTYFPNHQPNANSIPPRDNLDADETNMNSDIPSSRSMSSQSHLNQTISNQQGPAIVTDLIVDRKTERQAKLAEIGAKLKMLKNQLRELIQEDEDVTS
ncbi:uncharacterized protein I206_107410 [Kwoniella pini CBS 10737]|uniref:Uncharacterized protein n=1 Tax=Kwoniella pini CBS 10737 TaxID=1296096 RepID=A0A1B9HX73_9TREE|nr:uncharacterized protein I206_05736 [Kwoniella pini CBS 10737]OCF47873.1 hypothetical protein I206_05736 [Kwoniella pini CBS 10737]